MESNENRPRGTGFANYIGAFSAPASVALLPVSVVAFGPAEQPIDRLMALQSAIAKGVHLAAQVGRIRLKLPPHGRRAFESADPHAAPRGANDFGVQPLKHTKEIEDDDDHGSDRAWLSGELPQR